MGPWTPAPGDHFNRLSVHTSGGLARIQGKLPAMHDSHRAVRQPDRAGNAACKPDRSGPDTRTADASTTGVQAVVHGRAAVSGEPFASVGPDRTSRASGDQAATFHSILEDQLPRGNDS